MEKVVGILLKLQRMGVQIFLATHDYMFLKEFETIPFKWLKNYLKYK